MNNYPRIDHNRIAIKLYTKSIALTVLLGMTSFTYGASTQDLDAVNMGAVSTRKEKRNDAAPQSSKKKSKGSKAVEAKPVDVPSDTELPQARGLQVKQRKSVKQANKKVESEISRDIEAASLKIDETTLRAHIKYLSDDLLEGRGPASRGGMLAAKYIAAQYELMGLEPLGQERSYFQTVEMTQTKADTANKLTVKNSSGSAQETFVFGDNFVAGTDTDKKEILVNGEIVFVGYGISAPELNWDDYKGVDVKGKVLMIMVNDPPATPEEPLLFSGKGLTYYGRWTYKYEEAARRGAAGVLLIHTTESAGYGWQVVRNSWGGDRFGLVPAPGAQLLNLKGWVTEDTARKITKFASKDLDQLRASALTRNFKPVPLSAKVDMIFRTHVERITSPNVIGLLRGSDPVLKNEYVIYSAHWDHLGIHQDQPGDNIYNGAIDNATGLAGILSIAKAFSSLPVKPKRSILFLATTAEEQGLLGAEYYAKNPLVPIKQTVANINLDSMNALGTTLDISPLGAERSTLYKTIADVATGMGLTLSPDAHPEQGFFYRSDHFPFAKAGVPAVNFEPGAKYAAHSDKWVTEQIEEYRSHRYHQPADEYSPAWDMSGMVQQARAAYFVGMRIAQSVDVPRWNAGDQFEKAR